MVTKIRFIHEILIDYFSAEAELTVVLAGDMGRLRLADADYGWWRSTMRCLWALADADALRAVGRYGEENSRGSLALDLLPGLYWRLALALNDENPLEAKEVRRKLVDLVGNEEFRKSKQQAAHLCGPLRDDLEWALDAALELFYSARVRRADWRELPRLVGSILRLATPRPPSAGEGVVGLARRQRYEEAFHKADVIEQETGDRGVKAGLLLLIAGVALANLQGRRADRGARSEDAETSEDRWAADEALDEALRIDPPARLQATWEPVLLTLARNVLHEFSAAEAVDVVEWMTDALGDRDDQVTRRRYLLQVADSGVLGSGTLELLERVRQSTSRWAADARGEPQASSMAGDEDYESFDDEEGESPESFCIREIERRFGGLAEVTLAYATADADTVAGEIYGDLLDEWVRGWTSGARVQAWFAWASKVPYYERLAAETQLAALDRLLDRLKDMAGAGWVPGWCRALIERAPRIDIPGYSAALDARLARAALIGGNASAAEVPAGRAVAALVFLQAGTELVEPVEVTLDRLVTLCLPGMSAGWKARHLSALIQFAGETADAALGKMEVSIRDQERRVEQREWNRADIEEYAVLPLAARLEAVTSAQLVLLREIAAAGDAGPARQMIAAVIGRLDRCLGSSILTSPDPYTGDVPAGPWKKLGEGVLLRLAPKLWKIGETYLSRAASSVLAGCMEGLADEYEYRYLPKRYRDYWGSNSYLLQLLELLQQCGNYWESWPRLRARVDVLTRGLTMGRPRISWITEHERFVDSAAGLERDLIASAEGTTWASRNYTGSWLVPLTAALQGQYPDRAIELLKEGINYAMLIGVLEESGAPVEERLALELVAVIPDAHPLRRELLLQLHELCLRQCPRPLRFGEAILDAARLDDLEDFPGTGFGDTLITLVKTALEKDRGLAGRLLTRCRGFLQCHPMEAGGLAPFLAETVRLLHRAGRDEEAMRLARPIVNMNSRRWRERRRNLWLGRTRTTPRGRRIPAFDPERFWGDYMVAKAEIVLALLEMGKTGDARNVAFASLSELREALGDPRWLARKKSALNEFALAAAARPRGRRRFGPVATETKPGGWAMLTALELIGEPERARELLGMLQTGVATPRGRAESRSKSLSETLREITDPEVCCSQIARRLRDREPAVADELLAELVRRCNDGAILAAVHDRWRSTRLPGTTHSA